jgi:hypothetical protein
VRSNRIANKAPDKIPPGPKLDALMAEKVFGWKKLTTIKMRLSVRSRIKQGIGDEPRCQTIQLIRSTHMVSRNG